MQNISISKKKAFSLLLAISMIALLVYGALFYFSHGYIAVHLESDEVSSVQVWGEHGQYTIDIENGHGKKLVKSGDYSLSHTESELGGFTNISVPGRLSTAKAGLDLQKTKKREVLGQNPLSCTSVVRDVLYSWSCGSTISNANIHVPTTSNNPGFTSKFFNFYNPSSVEAILEIGGRPYAIAKLESRENPAYKGHSLLAFLTDKNLVDLANPVRKLGGLSDNVSYSFLPHNKGYVAFSESDEHLYLFDSEVSKNPRKIELPKLDSDELRLFGVNSYDDRLLLVYNHSVQPEFNQGLIVEESSVLREEYLESEDEGVEREIEAPGSPTEIYIVEANGHLEEYKFDTAFQQVRLCGEQKICALERETLYVFSLQNNAPQLDHKIEKVKQIDWDDSREKLLLVFSEGVVAYDPKARVGGFDYVFESSSFCGIDTVSVNYVLCARVNGIQFLLQLSPGQELTKATDKFVYSLFGLDEVSGLSVYKNTVFLSLELGEREYVESIGGFGYPPEKVKKALGSISSQIKALDLDVSGINVVTAYGKVPL